MDRLAERRAAHGATQGGAGRQPPDGGPLLVYGICEAEGVPPSMPAGIDGLPVHAIDERGLVALVSTLDGPTSALPKANVARVLAYEGVIEAIHRRHPVLPMRFGSVAARDELLHLLNANRERFSSALAELRGCVEMGVRILLRRHPQAAPQAVTPGTRTTPGFDYLRRRRQHFAAEDALARAQEAVAEEIRAALRGLAIRLNTEISTFRSERSVVVHFLLPRERVAPFICSCHALRTTCPGRLLVTGPWPPYNFVPTSSQSAQA